MRTRTNHRSRNFVLKILCFCLTGIFVLNIAAQKLSNNSATQSRTLTVATEPKAIVWLDDVRYGTTDESGKLILKSVPDGAHKIRIRADGFKEISQPITAAQKGEIKIALGKTSDEAELAFQEAERLTKIDRQKAIAAYQNAINLRPKFAEANLAMARVLSDSGNNDAAHKAIGEARKARLVYAEASAVEGRIYVAEGDEEKAIAAFKRAITEGRNFQPEALTGLGLLYKEKADSSASEGDFEAEAANNQLAANYFRKAVIQLGGAADAITIYQFLGLAYEKMNKKDEAIKIYEEFLTRFPDANEATTVRSFITQLKKEMSEQ